MSVTNESLSSEMNIKIPRHVAIMCDGNGRWGKQRGMSRSAGHKAGAEPIKETIRACAEAGVEVLTLYALSTENWSRPKEEITFLMALFIEFFKKLQSEEIENIKVHHIGITNNLPVKLVEEIKRTEAKTKNNTGMILNVALNYSGRSELTHSVKNMLEFMEKENLGIESINESMIDKFLFTSGQPDVDLIIRTSGEARISNFLLWQSAKAKIWITPILWPDFNKEYLWEAFRFYSKND